MRPQKQLRDELKFVAEFGTLLDVVQQVAVSQMRRLDEVVKRHPPLAELLAAQFLPLVPSAAGKHALIRGGARGRMLVVMTSDEGLVGPLHGAVVREAQRRADEVRQWLFIGQRGLRISELPLTPATHEPSSPAVHAITLPPEERVVEQMQRVRHFILTTYRRQGLKDVWLVAPRFLSATRQDVAAHQLLPVPVQLAADTADRDFVIEPSLARVVE